LHAFGHGQKEKSRKTKRSGEKKEFSSLCAPKEKLYVSETHRVHLSREDVEKAKGENAERKRKQIMAGIFQGARMRAGRIISPGREDEKKTRKAGSACFFGKKKKCINCKLWGSCNVRIQCEKKSGRFARGSEGFVDFGTWGKRREKC